MGLPVHTLVNERILYKKLKSIFPDENIEINVKKEINIKYSAGAYMEFDLWIPNLELCFEFQDSYHYETTWYHHNTTEVVQQKDNTKSKMAQSKGLSLVEIPCWWDGTTSSLIATINFIRNELFNQKIGSIIPLNPPHEFFQSKKIPHVGELKNASFPIDENKFRKSISRNWWMGEKYDGIRFCWNGKIGSAYSRNAKKLLLLPSIENQFPRDILDGELWFGRGRYYCTYTIFQDSPVSHWSYLRAIIFDVADFQYQKMTFETRYQKLLGIDNFIAIYAVRILCQNSKHLSKYLKNIIREGGEGIILQKCGSFYEPGRTLSLLKLKAVKADKEGIVLSIADDRSVLIKTPDGSTVNVPAQNVRVPQKEIEIGSIVTLSYESEVRRSIPSSLKIERIRSDLSWDDVLDNYRQDRDFALNETKERFATNPIRHWTRKSMRLFMENFAKNRNMDPLASDTWYTSSTDFLNTKGGKYITSKFKGGYFKAVQQLFPEISLNSSSQHRLWEDMDDRRKYFEKFAKSHGFDFRNTEYWYHYLHKINSSAVSGITAFHKGSLPQTLLDLFPDIGLDSAKLRNSLWKEVEKRRQFFIDYAKANEFNHLDSENWYSNWHKIWTIKGARGVAAHHNHNMARALVDLFPDIGLDLSKLSQPWIDVGKRRKFFETFADENKFDSRDPEGWYLNWTKLWSLKKIRGVIFHHENSVTKALMDLFPDIGLRKSKLSRYQWFDSENRKKFFENFAQKNNFDPLNPENWYQHLHEIWFAKESQTIASYHNRSLPNALLDLFPDIGLDKRKLRFQSIWRENTSRRNFFICVAKEHGFDPLDAESWYRHWRDIKFSKGVKEVAFYRSSSVPQTLFELFPDIGLDKKKFR